MRLHHRIVVWCSVFVMLALICSCATSGRKINRRSVEELQKGVTTRAEVHRAFGKPQATGLAPDGKKYYMYQYTRAKSKPESFVPVVGLFAGGVDINQKILQIYFDENDIVENFFYMDQPTEVRTGIAQ